MSEDSDVTPNSTPLHNVPEGTYTVRKLDPTLPTWVRTYEVTVQHGGLSKRGNPRYYASFNGDEPKQVTGDDLLLWIYSVSDEEITQARGW